MSPGAFSSGLSFHHGGFSLVPGFRRALPFYLARAAVLLPVWFGLSRGCLLALWVFLAVCLGMLRPPWSLLWCLLVPWVSFTLESITGLLHTTYGQGFWTYMIKKCNVV